MIESVKTTSVEKKYTVVLGKIKHYRNRGNKAAEKQSVIILRDIKRNVNTYA